MFINTLEAAKKMCEFSNWKLNCADLQKLLYAANVNHIKNNRGKPLFNEKFEIIEGKPIIPIINEKFKCFGNHPIPKIAFSRLYKINQLLCKKAS